MAADSPLAEVVQHLADGAAARGFISDTERQEMLDAAARGERPDVELHGAPPEVQAGVEHVLNQADALQDAGARLAEERDALNAEGRDQQERVGEIRDTANELRSDLKEAEGHVVIAEHAVAHAEETLGDAQNLVLSATSDADWQTARDLTPGLMQETRASLNDAVDQIEILHATLPDMNDRLETALADVTVLSAEVDAKDDHLARNQADVRDVGAGWAVLEAEADSVYNVHGDADPAHDGAGAYATAEALHADASHPDVGSDATGDTHANDAAAHMVESSASATTE